MPGDLVQLDASAVLGDLLLIAVDDLGVTLDDLDRRRLAARMSELLELASVALVREP